MDGIHTDPDASAARRNSKRDREYYRIDIKHPECMTGDAPKLRQDRGRGRRATHRRDVRNVCCTATGSIGTSGTSVAAGIIKQGLSFLR